MSDNVYRVIEVVGSSSDSMDAAIRNGVKRASEKLRNLEWFEVKETRGHIVGGDQVGHYQVVLKVGFRLD